MPQARTIVTAALALSLLATGRAAADDPDTELLRKIHNPVSDLATLPLRNSFESGVGKDDAFRYTLSVEPVVALQLTSDWLLVTRTVLPVIAQTPLVPGAGSSFGLGDTQLSLFLSPADEVGGLILGAGPITLLPTATDSAFASQKWGAGPVAVVLKQTDAWTAGLQVDHIWSFAGSGRQSVSTTLVDPFLSHTWPNGFSLTFETESQYDSKAHQWTVPLEAGVAQVLPLGRQTLELDLIGLYYAERAELDPRWGVRFTVNFIFDIHGTKKTD